MPHLPVRLMSATSGAARIATSSAKIDQKVATMTAIEAPPRRWDVVVRLTHWSIAAAILANALFTGEGSIAHVWIGYALAAILGLRLIWGLVGPKEARFTAFPPSPGRALAHVQDVIAGRRVVHASHNPLGALMVYAIWATLAAVIASGIAMAGPPDLTNAGATTARVELAAPGLGEQEADEQEASDEREGGEEGPLGDVHEAAVNLLYLLIVLHIAGVVFESRRSGRQIVMAMLPGAR